MYTGKQQEMALYVEAMSANGEQAQLLLKSSIDEMVQLRNQKAILEDKLEKMQFENKYIMQQMHASQSRSQESTDQNGQPEIKMNVQMKGEKSLTLLQQRLKLNEKQRMLGDTISHSLKSLGDHDEFKKVRC